MKQTQEGQHAPTIGVHSQFEARSMQLTMEIFRLLNPYASTKTAMSALTAQNWINEVFDNESVRCGACPGTYTENDVELMKTTLKFWLMRDTNEQTDVDDDLASYSSLVAPWKRAMVLEVLEMAHSRIANDSNTENSRLDSPIIRATHDALVGWMHDIEWAKMREWDIGGYKEFLDGKCDVQQPSFATTIYKQAKPRLLLIKPHTRRSTMEKFYDLLIALHHVPCPTKANIIRVFGRKFVTEQTK